MAFMLPNKPARRSSGFTLIEMLIIAPIVIITISGFIALMINMVGDVLVTRDQNALTYETQDALDRIEQDTRLTTQFLTTSGTLVSPQGSGDNTAAFTNTDSLILSGLTTDKNPSDATRQLVFYDGQPNACGAQQSYNRPFLTKIMYFVKDPGGGLPKSLWRRTVVPDYNTNLDNAVCATPWQRNSCSVGYSSPRCQTNDTELVKNIDTFSVKYFAGSQSTVELGASQALSATTIEVTINGKKTTVGRPFTTAGSIRATRLNSIDVDIPTPSVPSVTGVASGSQAIFTWAKVPLTSSYEITHTINGVPKGTTVNPSQNNSFTVDANRTDVIVIQVAAKNTSGTSAAGTASVTIPAWYTPQLQNNWVNFDPGNYSTAAYTKTSANVVVLKGVIRSGTATNQTELFTLPPGYRPAEHQIFQTDSAGSPSRIDVQSTGRVMVERGSSSWIVLDGIRFIPSTASYTWSGPAFVNGWQDYGSGWSTFGSTLDSLGRVHFKGLVKGGTNVNATTITTLPVGQRALEYTHVPASSNALFNYTAFADLIHAKGLPGAVDYYALQAMFYPTLTGWNTLTLQNNWVVFDDTGHSRNRYRKGADGIVTVKGLIKNGTLTAGTTVATLPPGFRPKERLCFASVAGAAHARFDVLPDGQIIISSGANSGWSSLDNIHFIAEQ